MTPPLPISDLHRLQLSYQNLTPVPSHASGSSEDLDYPCYPDYLFYPRQQPQHQSFPPPPQYIQQQQQPFLPSSNHYHHHTQHLQLKSEYARMPINMADVPAAPPVTKAEHCDDGKLGMTEMDQDEVDAIIRNKRKVRDPKACYACHRRKVKCNRELPCDSCVKRDHPELCSYERPTKKRRLALSNALAQAECGQQGSAERVVNSGPNITVPKEQWERLNQELGRLRAVIQEDRDDRLSAATEEQSASGMVSQSEDGDREGVHAPSNQMGTMHLGSRSVLAYMLGSRTKSTQDAAKSLLEENILPNLGLDNETTTYPFVDLWATDSSIQDVSGLVKALPEDEICREFFLTYRDIPCTIYPVVPDAAAFEQNLKVMLRTRSQCLNSGHDIDPDRPYGVTLPWLALLFAVLASGCQSTGRPAKERELTSQVYICCSYQALRMSNFLTHPCLETIEALLIIGNALSYNMNPGVSYILLGMTLRSALSMGLHVPSPNFSEHQSYLRSRIWWALAWQDSHFSVSYDRPSSSILCAPALPMTKQSTPGNRSYVESMTSIIKLTQEILRERALNPKQAMSWPMIIRYKDEVNRIWQEASPRLLDPKLCYHTIEHLERLALQIHCAYMISEICRPALKEDRHPTSTSHLTRLAGKQSPGVSPGAARRKSSLSSGPHDTASDPQTMASLRVECIRSLERVVETYVELWGINKYAARSWIGIQRSISAAFMLGVLPETRQEPHVIELLTSLENALAQSANEDSGFSKEPTSGSNANSDSNSFSMDNGSGKESPLWVRSMTKSLGALSKLNEALAAGKLPPSQQQYAPPPGFQPNFQSHAAAMYSTPAVSPGSSMSATSMPLSMTQYPGIYNQTGRSQGTGTIMPAGSQNMSVLGPFTPDSTSSEWNYMNMNERAREYIAPGLWG